MVIKPTLKWSVDTGRACSDPEIIMDDTFVCFNVALYVAHLWGMSNERLNDAKYTRHKWNELNDMRGVFLCDSSTNTEDHSFVLWIRDELIHYYSGYGGHIAPIYRAFNREKWFSRMTSLPRMNKENRFNTIGILFGLNDTSIYADLHEHSNIILNDSLSICRII
jgi:hypothetical protein